MGELALVRNHTRGELCVGNFGCRGGLGSAAAFALIAPWTKVRLATKNKAMQHACDAKLGDARVPRSILRLALAA